MLFACFEIMWLILKYAARTWKEKKISKKKKENEIIFTFRKLKAGQ